ncbi:Zinc finger and SCAN domain-containing protein 20 [Chelonia mydas]|uniref:Zinc finger and SCAN domain-containing protein 20 n=1 Tax=Chelonia mydas TaxID=8469 RepID=M7BEN1_CHEMY|nr:Zinc finger and SCAN domain-containing protein 20 [Chelonia mydas]
MSAPHSKCDPAWSTQEVVDLLGLWGEENVQAQLQSSHRHFDIYKQIAQGLGKKGYNRDTQQCLVKIMELWQAYKKAREANNCSGAEPQTCRFYKELHSVLGGDSTTAKSPMDTSRELESQAPEEHSEKEVLDDEEEE